MLILVIKGNLEVKLPTIWTDGKAEVGRVKEEKEGKKWEDQGRERVRKKKMQVHEKVGKSRFIVFPLICGSGGSKSRLAKVAGAEPAGQMRCRKSARRCGAKHISKSKCTKHTIPRPLWRLRCRKSARRCGAKHISKSKWQKHHMFRPLLEDEMSKKCTPLWREAHFQVKMYKAHHSQTTLEVAMSKKCTPLWREAHFQVKMAKTPHVPTTFGRWDVEKVHAVVARSRFGSQKCQNLGFWAFIDVQISKNCTLTNSTN